MENRYVDGVPIRGVPPRGIWRVAPEPRLVPPLPWQSWLAERELANRDPQDHNPLYSDWSSTSLVPAAKPEDVRAASAAGAPSTPGPSRYDDCDARFRVRYGGEDLRICLIEKLAQFTTRPVAFSEAASLLAAIRGVDDGYVGPVGELLAEVGPDERDVGHDDPIVGRVPDATTGIEQYLRRQRLCRIEITRGDGGLLVGSGDVLKRVEKDPRIQPVLSEIAQSLEIERPVLDAALIMLAGRRSRRLTQAISRVVYDSWPVAAITYASRHDTQAWNWALYADRAAVAFSPLARLDHTDRQHRNAVRAAAAHHEIALPHDWR